MARVAAHGKISRYNAERLAIVLYTASGSLNAFHPNIAVESSTYWTVLIPLSTQVTPGVLAITHKAFRDRDSTRFDSGRSGSIEAAICCVRARLLSAAVRRSNPKSARSRGTYRSLQFSHCCSADFP